MSHCLVRMGVFIATSKRKLMMTMPYTGLLTLTLLLTIAASAELEDQSNSDVVNLRAVSDATTIGTTFVWWTDTRREETWTGDSSDQREVGVRFFYPGVAKEGLSHAPLFVQGRELAQTVETTFEGLHPNITLHAYENLQLDPQKESYPLVLISHGLGAAHWMMVLQGLELSSAGFIVGLIEHPYDAVTSVRASGEIINPVDGSSAVLELSRLNLDLTIQDMIQVVSEDQVLVVDQPKQIKLSSNTDTLSQLVTKIDLDRVIIGGHSLGGMAADRSCLIYSCFVGGFTLDGKRWLPLISGRAHHSSDKPFLGLFSEAFWHEDRRFGARYIRTWKNFAVAKILGSRHDSFCNYASIVPSSEQIVLTEQQTHSLIIPILVDFVNAVSKSESFRVSELLLDRPEGVDIVDFEAMASSEIEADLIKLYAEN